MTDTWEQRVAFAFSSLNPDTSTSSTSVESNPSISGAKNSSGADKAIPLVLGKAYLAPQYCGLPYRTISGTNGETQTFHALYQLGYRNTMVSDIKLGLIDLSSGTEFQPEETLADFSDFSAVSESSDLYFDSNKVYAYKGFKPSDASPAKDGSGYNKGESYTAPVLKSDGSVKSGTYGIEYRDKNGDEIHTYNIPCIVYIPVSSKKGKVLLETAKSDNISCGDITESSSEKVYVKGYTKSDGWKNLTYYKPVVEDLSSIADISYTYNSTTSHYDYVIEYHNYVTKTLNGTAYHFVPLVIGNVKNNYTNTIYSVKTASLDEKFNGQLAVDGRWDATAYNIKLELQEGENTATGSDGEVALYPQKVVEEELSIELEHIKDDDDEEGYGIMLAERMSAQNPQKVEIQFGINGLYVTNSDGSSATPIQICIQYSTDPSNDSSWKNMPCPRNIATIPCSQNEGTEEWTTVKTGASATVQGKTYSGLNVYQINRKCFKEMRYISTTEDLENGIEYDEIIDSNNRYVEFRIFRFNDKGVDADSVTYTDVITLDAIRTWCFNYTKSKSAGYLIPERPLIESKRNITTRLGFQVDADDTDFKNQLNELNCILTSKCRTCTEDGDGNFVWSDSDELTPTSNPASVMLMLLQHESRGEYVKSDDDIDMQKLGELYKFCSTARNDYGGTQAKFCCNGVLTSQTKTSDIINDILSTCRACLVVEDGKYSVWIDNPDATTVKGLLCNQNILSCNVSKEYPSKFDGVKITFNNERNYYKQDELKVLYDKTITDDSDCTYNNLTFKYQTDASQIYQNGMYYLATKKLQPETISIKTSVDGTLYNIGDVIDVQSETLAVGIGDGAQITEILVNSDDEITGFNCDCSIDLSDYDITSDKFEITVQSSGSDSEIVVDTYLCTPVMDDNGFVTGFTLDTALDTDYPYAPKVGDTLCFGLYDETASTDDEKHLSYIKCIIFGIKDNGDGTFDFTVTPYQSYIYDADTGTIPKFDSKVTSRSDMSQVTKAVSLLDIDSAVETSKEEMEAIIADLYANHIVTIYKDSSSQLTSDDLPTGKGTYSFKDNTFTWESTSASNGWSADYPESHSGTVYVSTATAFGKSSTDDIESTEWASPIPQGLNGDNGYNTKTISLYARNNYSSALTKPDTVTYNFANDTLTGNLNSYSESIPDISGSKVLWEIHATALATTSTDTIESSEWSDPVQISDGVTAEDIKKIIEDNPSLLAQAPVVYCDNSSAGFAVDEYGYLPVTQSTEITFKVVQAGEELEFNFGTLPTIEGVTYSIDWHTLKITVASGTRLTTESIKIPIVYRAYSEVNVYVDEEGNTYTDEEENPYGYFTYENEDTTFNFGYSIYGVKGGAYLNDRYTITTDDEVNNITDVVIGDYFTFMGKNSSTYDYGQIYVWNGTSWEVDTSSSHSVTALRDVLATSGETLAEKSTELADKLALNTATNEEFVNSLVANEAFIGTVTVGDAFINQLQGDSAIIKSIYSNTAFLNNLFAQDITVGAKDSSGNYVGSIQSLAKDSDGNPLWIIDSDGTATFRSVTLKGYSTSAEAQGYASTAQSNAENNVYSTILTDNMLKTSLIDTDELFANSITVKDSGYLTSETFTDTAGWKIASDGSATFNNITARGAIKATSLSAENTLTVGSNLTIATDGSITAKNGSFTGSITATSGTFTGKVTASQGFFYSNAITFSNSNTSEVISKIYNKISLYDTYYMANGTINFNGYNIIVNRIRKYYSSAGAQDTLIYGLISVVNSDASSSARTAVSIPSSDFCSCIIDICDNPYYPSIRYWATLTYGNTTTKTVYINKQSSSDAVSLYGTLCF